MAEWVTNIITTLGYWGIGLLMFLENLFPPIPSELIMPLAGFTVARGEMAFVPVVISGVVGTLLGALLWYFAGLWLGRDRIKRWMNRHGKWAGLSGADVDKAQGWFRRYGNRMVFVGRLIPGVRTFISVPAGTTEMHFVPFLIYTTLGTLIWTLLLTYAGYLLGENYQLVEEYLGPISKIIVVALLLLLGFWLYKRWRYVQQKQRR